MCKVTDFGLSRSLDAQTQSILRSRTSEICRGTLVYMAPEIHTGRLGRASQEDLKMADIWSFAMVNPNLSYPYWKECESLEAMLNEDIMKGFMHQHQLPSNDPKYEVLRATEWWIIEDIYDLCARFDPSLRPTAMRVLQAVRSEESLVVHKLHVSQSSAIEQADLNFAREVNDGSILKNCYENQIHPQNDGTNACTFLAIAIGDKFLQEAAKENDITLDYLVRLGEEAINNLPSKINDHRDLSKMYDPSEAKSILEQNQLLGSTYDLSEECISANGVFSKAGMTELIQSLTSKQKEDVKSRVGLYTCCPYTFLVGLHDNSYFLIDTHPVTEEFGGDGNGILVATNDLSLHSCRLFVNWILKRLRACGLTGQEMQSLAWLIPNAATNLETGKYFNKG